MARGVYDARTRELAGDMYIHRKMSVAEISVALEIPEATLTKWMWQDKWVADSDAEGTESFANTCNYLMRTIHRMSLRLFQSTIPDSPDAEFILPDENLELRINRLTLAVERILPMGNMLQTKHRIDTIKEIKQCGFEAVSQGIFTDSEMMIAFRVVEHFLSTLDKRKAA